MLIITNKGAPTMTKSKNQYTATFSNGEVDKRGTNNEYAAAYRVYNAEGGVVGGGFARTEALARSAAKSVINRAAGGWSYNMATKRNRIGGIAFIQWQRKELAANGGKAAWGAAIAAREATYRMEVVPTQLVGA